MKNRNLYILFVFTQLLTPIFTGAQTVLSVTAGSGSQPPKVNVQVDQVILNNTTSAISQPGNKSPRSVVWIEYGDGQFTTSPETNHQFYQNNKSSFSMMLAKSTGIYAQGSRPPKQTARSVSSLAGSQIMPGNIVFADNTSESIHITPNVFDVVPGDTMMVALTYRKPERAPAGLYRLLFFYNYEGNVFEPMKPLNVYPLREDNGQPVAVPYVRTHNGEQLVGTDGLPEDIYLQYRNRFKTSGYLIFNMQLDDNREHHIFLTMMPRKDISAGENLLPVMDAVLLPPDKSPPRVYNHTSRLASDLASHDPNWQEVYPKCIVLPKKNQEMKHQIHFQNTGAGPARKVTVKTSLPTGLTGNDINVTGWAIGGVRNNPLYTLNVIRTALDSIVFEFIYDPNSTGKVLYGAAELPDAPVNAKTMGDIYFTCKAKPGTPNTMKSGTSIYFDNNEAVKTEETKVEFKKCCDCEKDCKKYKSKFLKWLLCKEC